MSVIWTNGDNYILCPYGENDHFISEARFSTHVVKCKKSSNISLAICPYNADHRLQVSMYQYHVTTCGDRFDVDMRAYKYDDETSEKLYPIIEKKLCHQVESWDEDDDPSYNPEEYCISEKIVRRLDVEPGSIRKRFRQKERARFAKLTQSRNVDPIKVNNNPTATSSDGITHVTSTTVSSVDRNENVNGTWDTSASNLLPLGSTRRLNGRGRVPRAVEGASVYGDGWIQVSGRGRGRGYL